MRYRSLPLTIAISILATTASWAATIRVPADSSTIQGAIVSARNGDIVEVAPGTYVENLDFLGKAIEVVAPEGATLDGNGGQTVRFTRGEPAAAVLDGFTITGGEATVGAGVYISNGTPTIRNCRFEGNTAIEGAGIYLVGAHSGIVVFSCSFDANEALHGNAVSASDCARITISNCQFRNHSTIAGTVIVWNAEHLTIRDSTFDANVSTDDAAGLIAGLTSLDLIRTSFTNNAASMYYGGAIYLEGVAARVVDSTFSGNTNTDRAAGAIYLGNHWTTPGSAMFLGCRFVDNEAPGGGGAIWAEGVDSVEFNDCTFESNRSAAGSMYGGACVMSNVSSSYFENTTFRGNVGHEYGSGLTIAGGRAVLTNTLFVDNVTETVGGGALSVWSCDFHLRSSVFEGNRGVHGGAMRISLGTARITGSIFTANKADHGSAMLLEATSASIEHCTFYENYAPRTGVGTLHVNNGTVDVQNSILLFDDIAGNVAVRQSGAPAITVTSSVIRGGYAGNGNLDVDPRFVNASLGDYHLRLGSPCIDAGEILPDPLPDFDGDVGPLDGDGDGIAQPDIGADEMSLEVAARYGSVGAAGSALEPVIFVNGSYGDDRRCVTLDRSDPLRIEMFAPSGGPEPARFVAYVYDAHPDSRTLSPQPFGLGLAAFPTPLGGGPLMHVATFNNLGYEARLGTPDAPSKPAPSVLIQRARPLSFPSRLTIQGFIEDAGSNADAPVSLTNAVVVTFVD